MGTEDGIIGVMLVGVMPIIPDYEPFRNRFTDELSIGNHKDWNLFSSLLL